MTLRGEDEVTLERVPHCLNITTPDGLDDRRCVRRAAGVDRAGNFHPFEHRRIKVGEHLGTDVEVGRGIRHTSAGRWLAAVMDCKEEDVVVVDADTDGDAVQRRRELCAAWHCPIVVGLRKYDDGAAVGKQERGTRRRRLHIVDLDSQERDVAVEAAHLSSECVAAPARMLPGMSGWRKRRPRPIDRAVSERMITADWASMVTGFGRRARSARLAARGADGAARAARPQSTSTWPPVILSVLHELPWQSEEGAPVERIRVSRLWLLLLCTGSALAATAAIAAWYWPVNSFDSSCSLATRNRYDNDGACADFYRTQWIVFVGLVLAATILAVGGVFVARTLSHRRSARGC